MRTAILKLYGRAAGQVADDLRSDPYLKYVLGLAVVLTGFWFWHRIPNFATRDEHSRLMDVLVAYGNVIADPSYASLREGIMWSRAPFGATFYLFGLAVLPVFLVTALTGQLDVFLVFHQPSWEFGFYPSWAATPEWFWTWSLLFVRLFNVCFAVGAVYLTYRIGTVVRDRATGRLAGVILSLTFGFLTIAKEGGEDMPATFFVLLALYLVLRYVQTDDATSFLAGSAAGGLAIAFKLTAAPVVALIGLAHLLRARRVEDRVGTLFRPWLIASGALFGLAAIMLGFPTLLVGGFDVVSERIFAGSSTRMNWATGPDAPIWWWFLRGYFSGLGLPLFVASVAGVLASAVSLRRLLDGPTATEDLDATALVLAGVVLYLLLFSRWHDFRVHHLLPTFPLLAILLARSLVAARESRPAIARPVIAALLVTSGIYAGIGAAGFASMPRDEARTWLTDNAGENTTLESYRRNMQDSVVPHGMNMHHPYGRDDPGPVDVCPEYIQIGYRDLLYLKNDTYYRNSRVKQLYLRSLLNGEYNYTIAAEFGTRPPNFVPRRATPGSARDLVRYGIVPQTDQFADEQELAANQYTVILERTGPCERPRYIPF